MTVKPIKAREADHLEFKALAAKAGKSMLDFVRIVIDTYKRQQKPAARARKS